MISAAAVCISAISCSKDVEEWNGNGGSKPKPEIVIDWKSRAKETYLSIVRNYRIGTGAASGLFKENYPSSSGDGLASFCGRTTEWYQASLLSTDSARM